MSSTTMATDSPSVDNAGLLENARAAAQREYGYSSEEMRQWLTNEIVRTTGKTPYKWQLDVSEALGRVEPQPADVEFGHFRLPDRGDA